MWTALIGIISGLLYQSEKRSESQLDQKLHICHYAQNHLDIERDFSSKNNKIMIWKHQNILNSYTKSDFLSYWPTYVVFIWTKIVKVWYEIWKVFKYLDDFLKIETIVILQEETAPAKHRLSTTYPCVSQPTDMCLGHSYLW